MNRKKGLVLLIVGAVVVAVVIANLRLSYEPTVAVEVTSVKRGKLVEKVSGPGVVHAVSAVKISSAVMGRIAKLAVREGDRVVEGDTLLLIEDSQYRARLTQADASHRAALARLELARARLADARDDLKRKTKLAESRLVSTREIEVAQTAYAVAEAEYRAAEHAVAEAQALLEAARDDLNKTVITSPMSGTVTSLNVEEGEIVITGTMNNPGTVIMTISKLDTMEVRAQIDETDVTKVAVGQKAEITVDAFPDTILHGVVSSVGSSARTGASALGERATFEVRIRILDSMPGLRPGMTTTVDIVTATEDSATYVPLQALVLREVEEEGKKIEREGIFIVDGGRSKFVPVRTGISDDRHIAILDSLSTDLEVIVGPFKTLRDLEDSTKIKIIRQKA